MKLVSASNATDAEDRHAISGKNHVAFRHLGYKMNQLCAVTAYRGLVIRAFFSE